MCLCIYIRKHIRIYTYIRKNIRKHIRIYTYIRKHIRKHIRIYTLSRMRAWHAMDGKSFTSPLAFIEGGAQNRSRGLKQLKRS